MYVHELLGFDFSAKIAAEFKSTFMCMYTFIYCIVAYYYEYDTVSF